MLWLYIASGWLLLSIGIVVGWCVRVAFEPPPDGLDDEPYGDVIDLAAVREREHMEARRVPRYGG